MRLILVLIISFNLVDAQNLSNVTFGGSNSLDVITWTIENFPKNGQQTIDSVAVIIQSLDADVIALQEIMNVSDFNIFSIIVQRNNNRSSSCKIIGLRRKNSIYVVDSKIWFVNKSHFSTTARATIAAIVR